jgi:cytochrome oxidase Cu insertion factor (SCO1/SenC/PrrC family)
MKISVSAPATPGGEITHSDRFVLVDADGFVRQTYRSNDDEAMADLQQDVRKLATETSAATAAPRSAVPQAVPTH